MHDKNDLVTFNNLYKKLIINRGYSNNLFFTDLNWKSWEIVSIFKFNNQRYFEVTNNFMKMCYKLINKYEMDNEKMWYLETNLIRLINYMFKNKEYIFINEYKYTLIDLSNKIRNSDLFHNSLKFQVFMNTELDTEIMSCVKENLIEETKDILYSNNQLLEEQKVNDVYSIDFDQCDIYSNFPLVYTFYHSAPKEIIYNIISQTSHSLLTIPTVKEFELPLLHLFLFYAKQNKKDDLYIIYVLDLLFYYSKYNLLNFYDMYSNNGLTLTLLLNYSDKVIIELINLQRIYNSDMEIIDLLKDKNDFGESFISILYKCNRMHLLKKI